MEISIKKKHSRKNLFSKLDNILKNCRDFDDTFSPCYSKYLESKITQVNSAFDHIERTDLNPMKFEANRAYKRGKERLYAYLLEKDGLRYTMNKQKLEEILHRKSNSESMEKFTFDTLQNYEISYLLTKNKRKFGEGFKFKGYSANPSPQNSGFPSIGNSPKGSTGCSPIGQKATNVNDLINTMLNKKLGFPQRKSSIKTKNKNLKGARRSVDYPTINMNDVIDKKEEVYLRPELKKYNINVTNNIKIQKMIIKQHAKERRESARKLPFAKFKVSN